MADTDTEPLANGTGPLSAEEEDERLKQRPADIDADVREMERRKRVEALMSSKLFREELERVLDQQMHEGNDAPLLQRIREMVGGRLHTGSMRGPACVLPINDIRGIEGVGYEKGEKILRCKLAAVYRLVDLFGWTQTGNHGQITARLNTAVESVLTTPRGLLPHEVTASSLVKVDMQGAVQDQGTTNFPVNVDGFSVHACVHAARPDVRCVVHVRAACTLAVSSTRRGVLPLSHEAALLGDVAYHAVPPGQLDNNDRDKLVRALGPHAKVLMLSGAGALCCGATLEEAFHHARNLAAACEIQLRLASLPLDELTLIDEETRRQIYEASRKPPSDASKWRVGGEEFEALMRMLDNAGFRTGYIYRHPLIKNDVPRPKNDVEVPPAVSSLGYLLEEEELYKQGLWKKGQGKTGERTRWLNSPNVYQKVEVLETGTSDPKKITKWVQDGSPAHSSTPVKIDTLQFVPKNTNPKEFKALQQQIKENRRADKISAGPQSHILEGVTWDEASKLIGEDAANTHTGDHVQVLMGAASKGIIQRGYQHNAAVYSAPYARNPFDHVTDTDIDEYRRTVERKQRSDYDTDLSESEAISAAQITSPASAPSETEEESRDEHRVLRIETKQAPVRSQPEVVLSDVDTTDFLAAERAHTDRTKVDPPRDPNLLSDDEVFLDSPVPPPSSPEQPVVIRGTEEKEALSSNKRSKHEYSRNTNFDTIVKTYDSPRRGARCKVSLTNRLGHPTHEVGNESSRSSLYSIPSIEWDGRCRSESGFRTRSLPRNRANKLFRTQSHSGFINAYMKDPEPVHYHVPRCRSCGATNVSYAFELNKEARKSRNHGSLYFSVDNLPQKCADETDKEPQFVKVQEKLIPISKVEKKDVEFVESQEFNEDNYIGDIGNSFSSENQTVIEKSDGKEDVVVANDNKVQIDMQISVREQDEFTKDMEDNDDELAEDINKTLESIEGEYHSFTDLEDSYESPVKELVEKDIRDYSVPIDFYCEDYKTTADKKSPMKPKNVLEPILEESKSSYGDDSNISQTDKNDAIATLLAEVVDTAMTASQLKLEITSNAPNKVTTEALVAECVSRQECYIVNEEDSDVATNDVDSYTTNTVQTAIDLYETEQDIIDSVYDNVFEILSTENESDAIEIKRQNSLASTLSSNDRVSFDTTAEFEKYELVADIITTIINRIDIVDVVLQVEVEPNVSIVHEIFADDINESFSIAKIIEDMEQNIPFNETVLTEASDADLGFAHKVVEGILYYIFNRAMFVNVEKHKGKKIVKRVITVADFEDILFTAKPIWVDSEVCDDVPVEEESSEEKDFNAIKDFFNAKCLTSNNEQVKDIDVEMEAKHTDSDKDINFNVVDNKAESPVQEYIHEDVVEEQVISCINTIVNDIDASEDNTNDCKDVVLYQDCKPNLTYIINEPMALDTNINLDDAQIDITANTTNVSKMADNETVLNETFIETSDMNNAFHEDFSHSEDPTISSHTEEIFATPDVDLTSEIKGNLSLETDTYIIEVDKTNDTSHEEYYSSVNDEFKDISSQAEEFASFIAKSTTDTEIYLSPVRDSSNEDAYCPEYRDISITKANDSTDSSRKRKYIPSKDAISRSSSPNRKTTKRFELTESPIKDYPPHVTQCPPTDMPSPFAKTANVLAMSQTEHSGGVKYWLSFDENPKVEAEKPSIRSKKSMDDTLPSFISLDIDENAQNKTEFFKKNSNTKTKRSSVLLNEFHEPEVAFPSPSTSNIEFEAHERVRELVNETEIENEDVEPQKKLLYELHSRPSKRPYSSWPPFEDTLFYRIISKFRMSESFDPNDVEDPNFDNSI
ncbi:uncharacterized protein LOC118278690 isoform X5 [Spodoptera frugiperda]|uniref:Uncharacterized protein LOC118278690 isoform X5 n=1 Tax=Spodoptera frugiperda TaxID=7108 RepID=A0A9R0E4Z5_SPOFR|nr:uncharacterized protein LOC118278690 isoform X5 [Spodoptera frugiperda]